MDRRHLIAGAVSGAAAAAASRVLGAPRRLLAGGWRSGPEIPTPRSEVAAATVGDTIYVLGGLALDGATLATVELHHASEAAWQIATHLPEPRDHLAAVSAAGRLWAIGGSPGWFNQSTSQTLWTLDPQTNVWEARAPMPLGRAAHVAAELGGRIYVAGGIGPEPQRLQIYDLAADRWSLGAPLPRPREHLAAAAVGDVLYVVGGRWGDVGNVATLEAYDPTADRWRALPPMPTPRGGLAAAALGDRLWVTGGEVLDESRVTFPQLEVYDPATDSWSSAPPTPTARHGLAAAVRNGELYVLAGGRLAGLDVSGLTEIYTPG